MHELSIAEEILKVAASHSGLRRRVKKIELALGPFAGVVQDSLEFCFSLAAKSFGLDGVELRVESLTAQGTCSACGASQTVSSMWTECSECGHSPLTVEGGRELTITSLEIEEEDDDV